MILELDLESLLVNVSAGARFSDVEAALARDGLTLDAGTHEVTITQWLAQGAPGARSAWLDPADHLVAGFCARAPGREAFTIRPAPRRAVGPDLLGLILGKSPSVLTLESVWLRVHRVGTARPTCEAFSDSEEPLTADERALYAAIDEAMG